MHEERLIRVDAKSDDLTAAQAELRISEVDAVLVRRLDKIVATLEQLVDQCGEIAEGQVALRIMVERGFAELGERFDGPSRRSIPH